MGWEDRNSKIGVIRDKRKEDPQTTFRSNGLSQGLIPKPGQLPILESLMDIRGRCNDFIHITLAL